MRTRLRYHFPDATSFARFHHMPDPAPDNGGGGGGGAGGGTGGNGGNGGQPSASGGTPPRTFTQEELDRIVSERLARERKKLQDLFGDDPEKIAQALKEQKDKEKSEAEKLREQASQAEAKAKAAEERAKTALIKAAFVVAAKEANIVDPEDALKLADLGQVQVDDQGTVKGVKEAIEALTMAKPYLVKQGSGQVGGPSTPPGGGGNNPTDFKKATPEAFAAELARYGLRPRG